MPDTEIEKEMEAIANSLPRCEAGATMPMEDHHKAIARCMTLVQELNRQREVYRRLYEQELVETHRLDGIIKGLMSENIIERVIKGNEEAKDDSTEL